MANQKELEQIRIRNFACLLRVMRALGPCSLSQVTERMNVGLTTVKKCMEEGLGCGMILLGETAESTGGRKAQQFLLNASYQYELMILVDNNNLLCRVYDFNRHCLEKSQTRFEMPSFWQCLCGEITSYVARYRVGVISLSMPCVIKDGRVTDWYYNPAMQGFDIGQELQRHFGAHAIVQNDMKLAVRGAAARLGEKSVPNLVAAQFGHNGVGVGEMVNGQVLEGAAGFAGEVGHTQDRRKNIMGVAYPAKIIRNVIICINPERIVFYRSERQNHFPQIFEEAVKGLPAAAVPQYAVSDDYEEDILTGMFCLVDQNGYFKKGEIANEQIAQG